MKNLLKYILIIPAFLFTSKVCFTQCFAQPRFILNGSAQQSPNCNTCSYHNYNEPGVLFGDEFDNRSFFNTDEEYLGLQWEIPLSSAVSIASGCPVGLGNTHIVIDGISGTILETKDIDISRYDHLNVKFSAYSGNACGNSTPLSDEFTVEYSFDGGSSWNTFPTLGSISWPHQGSLTNQEFHYNSSNTPDFDNGGINFGVTNFRLRFRYINGSGINGGNWAIDEVFVYIINNSGQTQGCSTGNFPNPPMVPDNDNFYFGYSSPSNPIDYSNNNVNRESSDNTLMPASNTSHPDEFELTPNCVGKGGSIWNDVPLDLNNDFSIQAKLGFGENNNMNQARERGSDGIAFVLQTDPRSTSAISTGGSIGYGNISPSLAVEMDTYINLNNNDPTTCSWCSLANVNSNSNNNHIAIQLDGVAEHDAPGVTQNTIGPVEYLGTLADDYNIEDGLYHDFKIEWNSSTSLLEVFFDDLNTPILSQTYDVINHFSATDGVAYWGFTASTGAEYNRHVVWDIEPTINVGISYNSQYFNCDAYHADIDPSNGIPDALEPDITGQGGGTFTISPNPGLQIDQTTGVITTNGATPGFYTITYTFTDINGVSCSTNTGVEILYEEPDFGYSNNNPTSFCNSETNPSPSWISSPGGTFSTTAGLLFVDVSSNIDSYTGEIDLANSTPGTYNITYETPLCSNPKVREVIILASPTVNAGADLEVCSNSQVTLTASGANSYVWYLSSDLNSPLSTNNPYQFNWFFANNNPRSFTVVGTASNSCTSSDDVTVTRVSATDVIAGTYNNVCVGTPVSLNGTGTGTYLWDNNGGDGSFDDATSLTAVYTPGTNDNTNGHVTLTLEVDQGPPCGVRSDNTTINFTNSFANNSVAINPTNPTPNDDLTANINTTQCVDVSTNDWRLDGSSIAPLNFSFNTSGTAGLTSKSTNPAVLSIDGTAPVNSQGPINANTQALDPCPTGHCLDFSFAGQLDANISTISPSDGISISLWTYSRDITSNGFRRWVQLFSTNPTDGTLEQELLLRQSNGHIIEAVVWSGIGPGSTNIPEWQEDFIYESNQIEQNVWQHWVLTFNNDQTMILYKDGGVDLLNDVFSTTAFRTGGLDDITAIRINANSTNFYDGFIDEVMVFDRVLTPQQVEALYNSGDPDYEKIVKEETNCGETWTLNSTPYNHIGEEGTATLSSSVSIPLVSITTQPSSGADVCLGTTASTMTVVASSGSGNYTYQWYTCQSDGSNPVIISGETNASFTPPTSSPGTTYYIVTVTDQDANCGSETSNVVSQKVDESITVDAGGDQTVCGNDVVNITGTITGGVSTGIWSASAAGAFGNASNLSTTFTPGASLLGGGTVDITLTSAANGACPAVSDQLTLTINSADAGFSYAYSEYCSDETNPVPTITGDAGTFSSTTGLVINSTTGEIDLTGSTAGTYTVTYTLTGACPNSSTFDVTITAPTVGFNYGGQTSFCLGSTCPSVVYTSSSGGVFSSNSSNLIVDPSTGEIDLVNSLPGNYEITYNVSSVNQIGLDITSSILALISNNNGVSMNSLGNRVAVGFPVLNQNNTYGYNGEVKVFEWDGSIWNQLGNVNSTRGAGGRTGSSIALSADGQTLAVISPRLSSGTSTNPNGGYYWSLGVLEIFNWDGSSWNMRGTPFFMNIGAQEDNFSLDINDDGTIVAVGECKRGMNATVTEGQVSVYEWDGSTWNIKGAVLVGENLSDQFGFSLSLNAAGNRIAVGTPFNDANKGEVKLYEWTNSSWNIIEEFNGTSATKLGHAVSLNLTGDKIAISESDYNSNAGAVSIYVEGTNSWNLTGNIIEGNSSGDKFGHKVELNSDGSRFLASSIIGIGYTKLYELSGSSWINKATVNGVSSGDEFGRAIDINGIGDRFIVGAPLHDNGGVSNTGEAKVFGLSKSCPEPLNITILPAEDASFDYEDICVGSIGSPSNIATSGGSYAFNPSVSDGATIDATTGQITNGVSGTTYTVEYSVNGTCPGSATQDVLIKSLDDASFSYASCCYWTTDTDPSPIPTVTASEGTYACSDNNLSMASNGLIDLSASLSGNYTIIHTSSDCPNTDTKEVLIMNANSCNTINFNVTGDASDHGSYSYEITPNQNNQVGAVWCEAPLNLNYPFHISANLNFGNKDVNGADGIAFVLQESSNTLTHSGGGLGYSVGGASGFSPSFAIEFDTYYNSSDAPAVNSTTDDHLAIQLNGDLDHSSSNALITPVNLGNIEVIPDHPVTIYWDPNPDNDLSTSEGELKVYFDNVLKATLSRDLLSDFTSSNNGMVYWGFTGSTGGGNNQQIFNYLNSSFWSGRNPTTLSDNINEWQGDVSSPTESITDPIDNTTQHSTGSWFNPCNWSASFVPDYNTDVVIPQQTTYQQPSYINHPLVNYLTIPHFFGVFPQARVLNLDMDADGDVDSDDQVRGKAFAKSLQLEGDALFFIKTDDGAKIQVKD